MSDGRGFAVIPVELARTPVVSAKAKAVYVALMSHAGEQSIALSELAKEVGTTSSATRKALDALYKRGWGSALDVLAPLVVDDGTTHGQGYVA